MHAPYVTTRQPIARRSFLRGAGAALISLPLLDAMTAPLARADENKSPPRFVAACATLGFHAPFFFPEKSGRDYEPTPYLQKLGDLRGDYTVFSGLSHPEQQGNNGHASELTWLTGAQRPGLAGFRNTISLDQMIAETLGPQTRYPCLVLSTSGRSMSWTASGVEIPGETSAAKLFKSLFISGTPSEMEAELAQIRRGGSILDTVQGQAKKLEQKLGSGDRQKLEEYLQSVRQLESRLQQSEGWTKRPKPTLDVPLPKDVADRNDAIGKQRLMYEMIVLALQTDSTRTLTFQLSGMNAVPVIPGVKNDWHNLSHHGKDPEKIEELRVIEEAEFDVFAEFLARLKSVKEEGQTLLDRTAVLFGSNLGNASSHDWHNVPTLLAGGAFRHGQHIAAGDEKNNASLGNLFVQIAQHMQLEIDRFGSSTSGSITGFEAKS